ncbi:integrase arm-type DNA-binding domain-containing protein [Shewanella algae]|uniref:integrase arm-type DNA-binding domain-containing protein n=1 Tax=Shewanella algae TaxID=38313 RepID=UPI003CC79C92
MAVTHAGSISFRYNYSINGRQETITFGRYGVGGITLAEASERLGEAKRMVADGKSPAKEKARDKARVKGAETFGAWAEKWLRGYQMADSTRDMRRSVYTRELETKFGNQKLTEITHEDLRALTGGSYLGPGAAHHQRSEPGDQHTRLLPKPAWWPRCLPRQVQGRGLLPQLGTLS